MVKNTEKNSSPAVKPAPVNADAASKTGSFSKAAATALLLLVVLGGGWYAAQNPQFLSKTKEDSAVLNREIAGLKEEVARLNDRIQTLQAEKTQDISREEWEKINDTFVKRTAFLNKRINESLQVNRDVLDSKASNSALLGVVTRVDELETKVRTLSKVSSQGALVLTAAMLVKDAAADGRPFVYEAEVLRQLAAGTNMEAAAETIARLAPVGIATPDMLIHEFNHLYAKAEVQKNMAKAESEPAPATTDESWKEKLNAKLSKLIVVEYNDGNKKQEEQNTEETNKVYQLVNSGNIAAAVLLMQTESEYQSEPFKKWQEKYAAAEEFKTALKHIQALTLAFMKVENLKNESVQAQR